MEIEEILEISCLTISDMPLLLSFVVAVHQALLAIIMGWGRMFKKFVTPSYCHCHGRHHGQTRCDDKSVLLSTADLGNYTGSKVQKCSFEKTSYITLQNSSHNRERIKNENSQDEGAKVKCWPWGKTWRWGRGGNQRF